MTIEELHQIVNDTRISVGELKERIAKLEEENERLKEILTEIASLAGEGEFPVLGVEIALRLGQWANGD